MKRQIRASTTFVGGVALVTTVAAFAASAGQSSQGPVPAGMPSPSASLSAGVSDTIRTGVTTVYYFHRTVRCQTCLTIEAYTREALESCFGGALAESTLIWRPIDVEEPGNQHFEDDFDLEFNSVIVARPAAPDSTAWWNLDKVWDLLSNKEKFRDYIRRNVAPALAGGVPPLE